ncbi:MATE family efflux transporter [Bradyrhizobium sp. 173]|uniref:MATE family efflux transporter n=1 Tax=Bradyrhizobium sp. 173 TaxID=2782644 RepID=UPI001FF7C14A|nr:MATE family efflux transporter [Bradyrhizobium sp. 173]
MVQRALRTGLWTALLPSFPIIAFVFRGEQILLPFGQAPDAARLAQQYLFGLALGVVPALWLQAIRNFMSAVNRPEPILWITLAAIPSTPARVFARLWQVRPAAGDVPGSVEFLKRSALPTLSR